MQQGGASHRSGNHSDQPFEVMPLGACEEVDWQVLRPFPDFLFRHVGDQARALLFVGRADQALFPRTGPMGLVDQWWYGHLAYGLKDRLERLTSRHMDPFAHPLAEWMLPRWVVEWMLDGVRLHTRPADREEALRFCDRLFKRTGTAVLQPLEWKPATPRERYLQQARLLMDHIQRGDIYEVNYCTQRQASFPEFDPFIAFGRMWERHRPTFAAFHRCNGRFALCASPERFLAFDGRRVVGQPMKGTRPRSNDPAKDIALAHELANDPKERSENIMALDVMRNDLSRMAASGTVQVDELCGVHAHPHVHQMTSTVSAQLREGVTPVEAMLAAFPMASMTGAPKIRAMELIDQVEDQARGLFSGTLGYFAPDGTADLNVVIRTILHHTATGLTTLSTGSALTALSDPAQEWEECEVKARSVMDAIRP